MSVRRRVPPAARITLVLGASVAALSGCGGGSPTPAPPLTPGAHAGRRPGHPAAAAGRRLTATRIATLPAPRERTASATLGGDIIVSGGLSSAQSSTQTVWSIQPDGSVRTLAPLPSPIHDAAATALGSSVLIFGGGQTEGSTRVLRARPGPPALVGQLPQALSDLDAVTVGDRAFVVGGWNGSLPSPAVYSATADGHVSLAGRLPVGLRYPAATALNGQVLVAGGEGPGGSSTSTILSWDPTTGQTTRPAQLAAPVSHAAGVTLGGRLYLIGGVRGNQPSDLILSWAPGEPRFQVSGHLPRALADTAAVPFGGGIAVIGGRSADGPVDGVWLLRAAPVSTG